MKIITNTHGRFLSTKQKLSEAKGKEEENLGNSSNAVAE